MSCPNYDFALAEDKIVISVGIEGNVEWNWRHFGKLKMHIQSEIGDLFIVERFYDHARFDFVLREGKTGMSWIKQGSM